MSLIEKEGVTGVSVGLATEHTSYLILIYNSDINYDFDIGYDDEGFTHTVYPVSKFFSRLGKTEFDVYMELLSQSVYPVYNVHEEISLWSEGTYLIEKGGVNTITSVITIDGINFVKGICGSIRYMDNIDIINVMNKEYLSTVKIDDNVKRIIGKEMVDSVILSNIIQNVLTLVGVSNIYSYFNYKGKIYSLKLVDNIDIEDEIVRDKNKIYSYALGAITTSIQGWNDNQDLSDNGI